MRVYLDTCAIQRPLDTRDQLRIRVEAEAVLAVIAAAEASELDLAASDVLRFENENNPFPARRDFARRVLRLATYDVASTSEVAMLAREYEQIGIKPMDAVHVASAVQVGADFFCTVDDNLIRKASGANLRGIRVVSPLELIAALGS